MIEMVKTLHVRNTDTGEFEPLLAIKGDKGDKGEPGKDGAQIAVGSYAGDGGDKVELTLNFEPKCLMLIGNNDTFMWVKGVASHHTGHSMSCSEGGSAAVILNIVADGNIISWSGSATHHHSPSGGALFGSDHTMTASGASIYNAENATYHYIAIG